MFGLKGIAGVSLAALVLLGAAPVASRAQIIERPRRASTSYDRTYQLGYDEGYRSGYDNGNDDRLDGRHRQPTDFKEYRRGDDGYSDRIGSRDQYKLGYRSGFEQGYDDGLTGRQYGARPGQDRVVVPQSGQGSAGRGPVLQRRGSYDPYPGQGQGRGRGKRNRDPYGGGPNSNPYPNSYPSQYPGGSPSGYPGQRVGYNASMVIELETPITTKYSQEGDRFSARVVEPSAYYGARVDGYIGRLERPGKVSGKGEVVLVFQQIVFPDGYAEPMQAQVEEVLGYARGVPSTRRNGPMNSAPWDWGKNKKDRNDDINAQAGDEGQIEGEGSKGRDAAVVGGGAAVGAVIGSVIGGGSGAAIGAAIGAATGGGVVASTRGSEIDLEPGAQLRIRTGQGVRY